VSHLEQLVAPLTDLLKWLKKQLRWHWKLPQTPTQQVNKWSSIQDSWAGQLLLINSISGLSIGSIVIY
jgi:hypothetical protein